MHPLFEEICRARVDDLNPSAFKRWQQMLRNDIQPMLDRLDVLERERSTAKAQKKPEVAA